MSKPDGNVAWVTPALTLNGDTWTFIYDARFDVPGSYTAVVTASNSVNSVTKSLTVPIWIYSYLPLVTRH